MSRRASRRAASGLAAGLALGVALVVSACGPRDAGPAGPGKPGGAVVAPGGRQTEAAPPGGAGVVAESSREILGNIVHAEATVEYAGWRTIVSGVRGESRETRVFVARYATGQTLLRWEGTGAAGTAAASDGGAPAPSGRRWTFRSRFPWVRHSDLLLASYSVSLDTAPSDPVAWRPTRRVLVRPLRPLDHRPSLDLLVDAETWLVLAETYLDAEGREVRSHAFESITFGTPSEPMPSEPAEPLPCADGEGCDGPAAQRPTTWDPLEAIWLPAGFRKVGAERLAAGSWLESWSDGLAAVTVEQFPAPAPGAAGHDPTVALPPPVLDTPESPEVRRTRWGDGASLATRVGGVCVFVSGNVADEDLVAVLRGLRARARRR